MELDGLITSAASYGYTPMLSLMKYLRKEKIRRPDLVIVYGKQLLMNYTSKLGDQLWDICEQTILGALDCHSLELAQSCLNSLQGKFPDSQRVGRLEGMLMEVRGNYTEAMILYTNILQENPSNSLVWKRQIAVLKAKGETQLAIVKMNEFLKAFPMDPSAWHELADLHMSRGNYRQAAFCFEEIVTSNPLNFHFHSRLAELYVTIGGLEQYKNARKHYCKSLELNTVNNIRAQLGLLHVTQLIASQNNSSRTETDDLAINDRIMQKVTASILQEYEEKAPSALRDLVFQTFSSK